MKISRVIPNNRRKVFEVYTRTKSWTFPYAAVRPSAGPSDPLVKVWIDKELASEAFVYRLASGAEGVVHIDYVLEYNRDPAYMTDQILYELTVEAQKRIKESPLSTREVIRRLGTSATQFYRLMDQTNYRKSIGQMISLLSVLNCDVDLVVRERRSA